MSGTVGILNVGAGDTKLSFDPSNPAERIRAARIVRDMLRRGYALLVETTSSDGTKFFTRATDFDEETCEYVIADFDPVQAQEADHAQADQEPAAAPAAEEPQESASEGSPLATPRHVGRRVRGTRKVAAESTRSVAVARTAGG